MSYKSVNRSRRKKIFNCRIRSWIFSSISNIQIFKCQQFFKLLASALSLESTFFFEILSLKNVQTTFMNLRSSLLNFSYLISIINQHLIQFLLKCQSSRMNLHSKNKYFKNLLDTEEKSWSINSLRVFKRKLDSQRLSNTFQRLSNTQKRKRKWNFAETETKEGFEILK